MFKSPAGHTEHSTKEVALRYSDDDSWHVIPVDDLVEHETSEDCPCGPQVEIVMRVDAPDAHLYHHSALDGHELLEQGRAIPKEREV